jgi:uncharacterized protein
MRKILFIAFLISISLYIAGCSAKIPAGRNATACFGSTCLASEVMSTPEQRELGLMYRDSIECDRAMIFVFEKEGNYSFWMKNMKFPIDIIWVGADKKVVHVEKEVPACDTADCPVYSPGASAATVIETCPGFSDSNNISLGTDVVYRGI